MRALQPPQSKSRGKEPKGPAPASVSQGLVKAASPAPSEKIGGSLNLTAGLESISRMTLLKQVSFGGSS